jgi:hypothetical protein
MHCELPGKGYLCHKGLITVSSSGFPSDKLAPFPVGNDRERLTHARADTVKQIDSFMVQACGICLTDEERRQVETMIGSEKIVIQPGCTGSKSISSQFRAVLYNTFTPGQGLH